jgi:hypothetical protein
MTPKRILMGLLAVFIAVHSGPAPLSAQQRPTPIAETGLRHARTLHCQFGQGHTFEWRDGEPIGIEDQSELVPVLFDDIDREAGRARRNVFNDPPAGDPWLEHVAVIEFASPGLGNSSTYGMTFITEPDAPHLGLFSPVTMTTVWSTVERSGEPANELAFPAVFSHHVVFGGGRPAQYPGWCNSGK